ncbi:MAG: hypothetical protein NVSMB60_27750 [Mycobacterium sp.]
MSNPSGPDQPDEATQQAADAVGDTEDTQQAAAVTDPRHEPATEILLSPEAEAQIPGGETQQEPERRFTAPSSFDAGATQKIEPQPDPATEVMPPVPTNVAPQLIPGRRDSPKRQRNRRSWGWVVALLLVIAALVAVAILGTVLLTRNSTPKASGADKIRASIHQSFVSDDEWKIPRAPDA